MHKPERWAKQARTIRADLVGANGCHCAVAGLYAYANSAVQEMCRLLVRAGYDPGCKLVCFRGATLSLTVHHIGDAVRPKANSNCAGFEYVSGVRTGSPMRKARTARISAALVKGRSPGRRKTRGRRASKKRVIA